METIYELVEVIIEMREITDPSAEQERISEIVKDQVICMSYSEKGDMLDLDKADEDESEVAMIADAIDTEVNKGNVKTVGDMLDLMVNYVVIEAIHRKLASPVSA